MVHRVGYHGEVRGSIESDAVHYARGSRWLRKTTQAALTADALEAAGYDVLRLREPGGVAISEKIRAILLDPANGEMGDVCELLLYEAARAQLVHQVIKPALAEARR